ncbi:hypothetical protein ARMGADRAFT_1036667 [Armillaria gallica]|uniref:Uncharacterized protein n=1 Tax=Armillaria gallica TaxID=47427 RepID=A0A2H3CU28_ARMGA|nr:hypothetical protein ARMGADRAFT_1036667 [Armillaria gallica]
MASQSKHTLAPGQRFSVLQESLALEGATGFQLMINSSRLKYNVIIQYTTGPFSSSSRIIRVRKALLSWDYASKITLILIQAARLKSKISISFNGQSPHHIFSVLDFIITGQQGKISLQGQCLLYLAQGLFTRVQSHAIAVHGEPVSFLLAKNCGLLNVLVQVRTGDMRSPGGTG